MFFSFFVFRSQKMATNKAATMHSMASPGAAAPAPVTNDDEDISGLDYEATDALFDDINFDQIDDDLAAFQEDDMVQQALSRGVDLQKYGRELEKDLKIVRSI
jgi:hypothetical protein